ncbi:ribbon-helix-helix protein, CopG family [Archaeoglobus neptunius]|uniref:ribbon-helix-helix protein, CopG family n=1 Tax=Archaeoglobus neptunius TaxID=2798580 RepID=UPI001926952A|nr:ribbon-helix-helix protein, CopG family [Archaeoglobus neptunius]
MRNPVRVTIAFDDESFSIFEELKRKLGVSQSEIIRRVIKFYSEYMFLERLDRERVATYVEMLAEGEHVILDIDHWVSFLEFLETHPNEKEFWRLHKEIAEAHAEEFKGKDMEYILKRLEACNFFRLQIKEREYVLLLNHEKTKKFVREMLEVVLEKMGFEYEMKEDLMKLRIRI